ncbi:hypothetical protein TNCV_4645811 [Trichonephila clavipes]|nr:hypothetical protein TNCV_4645811 [Trichonephila clavipes]
MSVLNSTDNPRGVIVSSVEMINLRRIWDRKPRCVVGENRYNNNRREHDAQNQESGQINEDIWRAFSVEKRSTYQNYSRGCCMEYRPGNLPTCHPRIRLVYVFKACLHFNEINNDF